MKVKVAVLAVMAAVLLVVSGCSATSSFDSSNSGRDDNVTLPESDTAADEAPEDNQIDTNSNNGATSRPGKARGSDGSEVYDTSQEALANFQSWWNYEVQTHEDAAIDAHEVYEMGIEVCLARSQRAKPTTIENNLKNDYGYTGSGAQALIVSAHNALCPKYNTGYKSYFDKLVAKFQAEANKRITYSAGVKPTLYDHGFFLKEACAFMGTPGGGGSQIYDHMVGMSETLVLSQFAKTDQVMYIYINQAVNAGCFSVSSQLPPVIQMTP